MTINTSSINLIEWQTTSTIHVSWSNPTLGRYEAQTWRAGLARMSGVCVLTGALIYKGDAVFRPLLRTRTDPANAHEMILMKMLTQQAQIVVP
ncbi:DUF3331 domain-containing protein [Paraburkholderia sp. LEh10]|uniref:DUF3331 domain-containing protein n=1 Tax=Paraburkholderia sp. LEh10 TaxID=2821353 RepID=UPI001AE4E98B|nr:DUF3331 domain-containing protein [Paraburkholderia sp. LEh10]MBP0589414.1 DUF3331 domain-containing protein [Paraburkholderia sp. LEh10]